MKPVTLKQNLFYFMKCHKGKYSRIKMDNHTVAQLKAIAKELGIGVYYKLRKAELIHTLEAARLVEQKSNIFDESIPNDATPVLQPAPWRLSNVTTKVKQNTKKFLTKGMQKIKDFGEWLLNYIPPKPKVVDKVLESFNNKIKKNVRKEGYFASTNTVQICFEKVCDSVPK